MDEKASQRCDFFFFLFCSFFFFILKLNIPKIYDQPHCQNSHKTHHSLMHPSPPPSLKDIKIIMI